MNPFSDEELIILLDALESDRVERGRYGTVNVENFGRPGTSDY